MIGSKISFVVIARNEPQNALSATVAGLLETTAHHDRKILLIDDGSDIPVISPSHEIALVRNVEAIGVSRSRRLGASLAEGDVLVWLDAHMSFAPDWLDRMLQHLDADTVLCSAFYNYDRSTCHAWGADFVWHRNRNDGTQRYPGFAVRHRTRFPGPGAVDVPMLIGGCYMMRHSTYLQLGGFSPLSRVRGGNEQDLSARAWIGGLRVRCVADARVGHLWRPRFPYPVQFAHLEFNQLALVRTVFEDATVRRLEECFQPYPPQVQKWLDEETGFEEWRRTVQLARKMSDAEFFDRFVPDMQPYLRESAKPPHISAVAMQARSPVQPKISFVLAARDEPTAVFEATIDGLLATSTGRDCEIIVVDDGSAVPVAIERPQTRIVRNPKSIGVAQSRRYGVSIAKGDILVCLDAHMRFAPDWLDQMLKYVDSGALLCAAWWDYELTRPLCWGADFVWCGERDYTAGHCPGFGFRHRTTFPGDGAVEVPMLIGACYMMLRSSYERLGGYSPFFRTWGKLEQDLSARAWIVGLGVKCVTDARVGHFSRKQFPYPVRWEDIEFNQVATVRTVFEEPTARAFEELLQPLPKQVQTWLSETDFDEWRQSIQAYRSMSDHEFFRRFIPNAPERLFQAQTFSTGTP